MAQKTDAELDIEKDVIKNETDAGDNTATRVGQMFENLNDSKINNDKIETDAEMVTAGKTVAGRDAVKDYIAAQLAALDTLFLGLYTSLGALESTHPTADSGQYAIVDPGSGTDAVKYIWDEDEGWVAGSGAGVSTFAGLTDDPRDNTDLADYLDEKSDAFPTERAITGAHTLDATDLANINAGKYYILNSDGNTIGIPLNATVPFAVGTFIGLKDFTTISIAGGGTLDGTNGTTDLTAGVDLAIEYLGSDTWTLHNGLPDASDTVKGIVELATPAEALTGTDTVRAVTPEGVKAVADTKAALAGSKVIQIAFSDPTSAITAGNNKVKFRMPYAMTLTAIRMSLGTAQASGSIFTVDVNEAGSTILSTKLTIDNTEKTSTTAATPAVISDTALADDAEITIDVDQVGDGTAVGGLVTLIGY